MENNRRREEVGSRPQPRRGRIIPKAPGKAELVWSR